MNRQYCPPRWHSLPPITIVSPLRRISRICLQFFDGTTTSSFNLMVDSGSENQKTNIIQWAKINTETWACSLFLIYTSFWAYCLQSHSLQQHILRVFLNRWQGEKRIEKQEKNSLAVLTNSLHLFPGGRKECNELFDEAKRNGNWHWSWHGFCTIFLLLIKHNHQTIYFTNSAFHSPFSFLIDIFGCSARKWKVQDL